MLCLDVSRWGRFQDIDLSAQYSAECKQHGKQVVYTTIGMARKDDNFQPVYVQFERFRAAQYSKELSDKVWRGCVKIAQQGYWAGGAPPYGLERLLLDERREPVHVLEPGQRKSIQNQRVTLVVGEPAEVAVIQRIFHEFVELGLFGVPHCRTAQRRRDPFGRRPPLEGRHGPRIACATRSMPARWSTTGRARSSKRPATPIRPKSGCGRRRPSRGSSNPSSSPRPRRSLPSAAANTSPTRCSPSCDLLHERYGLLRSSLVRLLDDAPSPATFAQRFGGWDHAFQQLYREPRDRARELVHERIRQQVPEVLPYADFLVLDQRLTVSVQPAVPIPRGYAAYWPFRPDRRNVIDITLGVLLSDPDEFEILGYVALPRWTGGSRPLRIGATSSRTELFGRRDLDFLEQLL